MKVSSHHGFLVIDKPLRLTSRDAVDRAAGWFPRGTRLGHAGTLDPLATGVLVISVGGATRLTEYVQRMQKTYHTVLRLGARSRTDDAEGTIQVSVVDRPPGLADLESCLAKFVGEIEQVPPAFSAAKVSGRRAYDLARRGASVPLAPRRVRVDEIRILDFSYPRLELEIRCGKGTYVRALARDVGECLGCGALVESLRRTRVGRFDQTDCLSLDADQATDSARLLPLATGLSDLPVLKVTEHEARRLRHGQGVVLSAAMVRGADDLGPSEAAVLDSAGNLVAVAILDRTTGLVQPSKVVPDLNSSSGA